MKTQKSKEIGVCILSIIVLSLQPHLFSAESECTICDQNAAFNNLLNQRIGLGDSVIIHDTTDGDKLRDGWPAIVVGEQNDGFVLLFNKPDVGPAWYERQISDSGRGYPWDDRVRCVGLSWAVVDPNVLSRYVDSSGASSVAAYISTECGVIRDMDGQQLAGGSIIVLENRGGCYELPGPEIENRPWSDLYDAGDYRISGFRKSASTQTPEGDGEAVYCDQGETTYVRLGQIQAPMAVFPCAEDSSDQLDLGLTAPEWEVTRSEDHVTVAEQASLTSREAAPTGTRLYSLSSGLQFTYYLPSPVVECTGTEDFSTSSGQFTRYRLSVTNWNFYPDELFAPSPQLPPCGSNTSASRTWVLIYSCDNNEYLYGFCGLNSADDLTKIWFARRKGQAPPRRVLVKLYDRACNRTYTSDCVEVCQYGCGDEDLLGHNPNTARVAQFNGRWKIMDGNHIMKDFGNNEAEARQALSIIKYYGIDSHGFVGRPDPSMEYWLVDGQAPVGPMPGEDAIGFNPGNIEVRSYNGSWKIVEGNHWILDFGSKEDEARKALCIIKKYGFTRICFVGRPNPSMTYFRKGGDDDISLPDLPSPDVECTGTEDFSTSSGLFTRYRLSVSNWNSYPDELFTPSPQLPPCGNNTKASRTWVKIYSCDNGAYLYGFCTLASSEDLTRIWFALRKGQTPPNRIRVELHDRKCNRIYKSACVQVCRDQECGTEDIIHHNPATTRVALIDGHWKIVDGNHWMMDFGSNYGEAQTALKIIKYYGLDSRGFVGRPDPSMEYWLVDGRAPVGPMQGEDSVPFNPDNIEVRSFSGRWKIVEGNHWILDFGSKEDEARKALCIIRKYGFTRICFVGRPGASMIYFRR